MADKSRIRVDRDQREGHGDEDMWPKVTKGTFIDGGGTAVDVGGLGTMKPRAHSSNDKGSGHPGGVAPLS